MEPVWQNVKTIPSQTQDCNLMLRGSYSVERGEWNWDSRVAQKKQHKHDGNQAEDGHKPRTPPVRRLSVTSPSKLTIGGGSQPKRRHSLWSQDRNAPVQLLEGRVGRLSVTSQAIQSIKRSELRPGSPLALLCDQVVSWRDLFRANPPDKFWHRKSKKVVLAVLMLNHQDTFHFIRATNIEVSMPAGSLCAERNAFGAAVAMFPEIRRENFLGIAVLSNTEEGSDENLNPLAPCGVCCSWLEKIYEVNPEFRLVTFSSTALEEVHVTTLSSLGASLNAVRDHMQPNHTIHMNHATGIVVNQGWSHLPSSIRPDAGLDLLTTYHGDGERESSVLRESSILRPDQAQAEQGR